MPTTLERGGEPRADDLVLDLRADQFRRQAEDVEIVVPPAHLGGHLVVAGRRPDAGQLIRRDRHAHAGAAQEDAAVDGPAAHAAGHISGNVGVVDGLIAIGSTVDDLVAHPFEESDEPLA